MSLRIGLTVALSMMLGCVGFDTEEDLFLCESNDDCADGFVCSGHTISQRKAVSYCIAEGDAQVGIAIDVSINMFGCEVFPSTGNSAIDVEFYVDTSPTDVDWDPAALPANPVTCNDPTGKSDEPCCFGTPEAQGRGDFMCVLPADDDVVDVAMWVRYICGDSTAGCTTDEVLMVAFGAGEVPTNKATLVNINSLRSYDEDLVATSRCSGRAMRRRTLCPSTNDCSCSGSDNLLNGGGQCPPAFFCLSSGGCSPAYYAPAGVACNDTDALICRSNNCVGGQCGG